MKTINLTKGQFCMVDDEDYDFLNSIKWYAEKRSRSGDKFCAANGPLGKMHRLIMKCPSDMEVDHRDGNPLNNQKSNLRICTHKQNCQNKGKSRKGSSMFHGVYWLKINKKWNARIKPDRKPIHLGCFESEIDAAQAYDEGAKKYFGEFAHLNFK